MAVIGILGLAAAAFAEPAAQVKKLWIVRDGKPEAQIIIPDETDLATKQAAQWIQKYVKAGTGAELAILAESRDTPTDGTRIFLGATKAAARAKITADKLKWDGCRLVARDGALFLLGRHDPGLKDDPWMAPKGNCRAAATFLEDFCGIRWFIKRPDGELVPKRKEVAVPTDLDRTVEPAFGIATGSVYGFGNDSLGAYANNFRIARRKWVRATTAHTWTVFVPVENYYKDHPEYFAMINGKRSDSPVSHLCTSNPDVRKLMVEGLRGIFDKGYDWAPLAQADGAICCACDACKAKFGAYEDFSKPNSFDNPCERIHIFHDEITRELMKSHPNCVVEVLLYDQTRFPSKQVKRYPDNAVLSLCSYNPPSDARFFDGWADKGKALQAYVWFWGIYHAPGLDPTYTARQVADSLRFLRDRHAVGVTFDGIANNWGLEGHSYYACGKLLGNPDLDPHDLVREYCLGVYGPQAGPLMIHFFDVLDGRVNLFRNVLATDPALNNTESVSCALYPPTVINELETSLRNAEQRAQNETHKKWLTLTRISFDHLKLNAQVYTLYRSLQINDTLANFEELRATVEKWRENRALILSLSNNMDPSGFPGWYFWRQQLARGGQMAGVIKGPFLWDFDKMRAHYAKGTPAALQKVNEVRKDRQDAK